MLSNHKYTFIHLSCKFLYLTESTKLSASTYIIILHQISRSAYYNLAENVPVSPATRSRVYPWTIEMLTNQT